MAATGDQPVSASNLSAALGAGAGSGLTGTEPICVDNLKAALGSAAGVLKADSHLLFISRNPTSSGTLWAPIESYSSVTALMGNDPSQFEPWEFENDHGPVDHALLKIAGTGFTMIGSSRQRVYAIIGHK